MESRHLGPILLDGGAGGGAMEETIDFAGEQIRARLEIDYPDRLTQAAVDDIDVMLDHPQVADGLARDTIASALRREDSAAAQLFQAWEGARWGRDSSEEEFLRALRPVAMTITPDGGRVNPDRVALAYGVGDGSATGLVTVRLRQWAPPEVDRTLARGAA